MLKDKKSEKKVNLKPKRTDSFSGPITSLLIGLSISFKGSYFIGICDNCLGQGETTSGKLIFGRNVFVETERDHTDYTTNVNFQVGPMLLGWTNMYYCSNSISSREF